MSPSASITLAVLVSDSFCSTDLIISWKSMLYLGMLVLPIARTLPSRTRSTAGVFSVVAPTFPGTVSSHSILSIDNGSSNLPAPNIAFLKNPPPMKTYPPMAYSSSNWLELVTAQGKAIRQALLSNYPLAFSDELGNSTNYAAVAPIKISINPGAKPINRTTCPRAPAGLKKSSKMLIERLLKEGVIRRWDKPSI